MQRRQRRHCTGRGLAGRPDRQFPVDARTFPFHNTSRPRTSEVIVNLTPARLRSAGAAAAASSLSVAAASHCHTVRSATPSATAATPTWPAVSSPPTCSASSRRTAGPRSATRDATGSPPPAPTTPPFSIPAHDAATQPLKDQKCRSHDSGAQGGVPLRVSDMTPMYHPMSVTRSPNLATTSTNPPTPDVPSLTPFHRHETGTSHLGENQHRRTKDAPCDKISGEKWTVTLSRPPLDAQQLGSRESGTLLGGGAENMVGYGDGRRRSREGATRQSSTARAVDRSYRHFVPNRNRTTSNRST